MISELFEKSIRIAKERRILSLAKPLGRRIPRFLFDTKCALWDARELETFDTEIQPDIPVTMSLTDFEETRRWIESLHVSELLDKRDLRIAVREGHYWGSVKHGGKIIGCIKICHGQIYLPDFKKTLRLPAGIGYITDLYLLPEYRGKKIGPWMLVEALAFMKSNGFTKEMGFTEFWNPAAQRFAGKVKKTREKRIRFVRILGWGFFLENPVDLCFEQED